MKITEDIIERFFSNECNDEERKAVRNFFIRHPERLEKYLTESSWQEFEMEARLPVELSGKMLSVIRANTYVRKQRMNRQWAGAAAAVLLLGLSSVWFTQTDKKTPLPPIARQKPAPVTPTISFAQKSNKTSKATWLNLPDGSKVKLEPGAELVYADPFPSGSRNIEMKGKAVFYVASEAGRPFTVHAGQLSTTALGTVFSVSACEGKTTRVHLLSGKVRVDADSSLIRKGLKSTILLPGQELKLDASHQLVITRPKEKAKKLPVAAPTVAKQQAATDELLVFHNEPLSNIFNTLSGTFKTTISFRPEQLTGMSFTGKFDRRKESLYDFIQTISSLNNLTAVNRNGTIRIIVQ